MIAQLIGLPRWAQALGGAALLLAAFGLWLHFHDRAVIAANETKTAQAVATASASAAAAASTAAAATKTEVEQDNAQARDAANRSADPLGDGLRRLRARQAPPEPGPR